MGQNVLVENTEQDASCTVVDMELDEDSHSKTPDHYESINQNQSAPLYIIKCNSCPEGIHHSSITKQEHELAVLAYAARHNVSDTGLSDLLALINLYLPESNLLDTNISKLKEKCGFNGNFLNNFIFCNICKNILKSDQETCITPDCPGQTPSSKNKSFFMTADLTSQLKNILIKPDLWGSIQENAERKTTTITDITDGEAYLLLKKEGNFLYNKNNITLTLFTDGVPLFKSSGVSMWPVYLLIMKFQGTNVSARKICFFGESGRVQESL